MIQILQSIFALAKLSQQFFVRQQNILKFYMNIQNILKFYINIQNILKFYNVQSIRSQLIYLVNKDNMKIIK